MASEIGEYSQQKHLDHLQLRRSALHLEIRQGTHLIRLPLKVHGRGTASVENARAPLERQLGREVAFVFFPAVNTTAGKKRLEKFATFN